MTTKENLTDKVDLGWELVVVPVGAAGLVYAFGGEPLVGLFAFSWLLDTLYFWHTEEYTRPILHGLLVATIATGIAWLLPSAFGLLALLFAVATSELLVNSFLAAAVLQLKRRVSAVVKAGVKSYENDGGRDRRFVTPFRPRDGGLPSQSGGGSRIVRRTTGS